MNATETFRDRSSLVKEDGKRKWIYANQPSGKYYTARTLLTILYLIILVGLPFLEWNGNPLFLLDIPDRKIILFGVIFTPQDFFLLMLSAVSFIVFIVLFTVVFGRIFCGWVCPQTIFMEMIFRRIEYWIEGSAEAQKRLNAQKWNAEKYFKKILKHAVFWGLSFIVANIFLSYIIGIKQLWKIITEPVSEHIAGFSLMLVFTTVFYAVFAFLREIACVVVCPYGRLQGVLLDKNSIVVAYDYVRGEPRTKGKRKPDTPAGDCIDCGLCVRVCPTGIDIRNGTQMECINCTACIDACDTIMKKVNKPTGLIRYASAASLEGKQKSLITPRVIFYSVVLLLLVSVTSYLMFSKSDLDVLIMRSQGQLYQEQPNNKISNLYTLKVENKSPKQRILQFEIEGKNAEIQWINGKIDTLNPGQEISKVLFVLMNKQDVTQPKNPFYLVVKEQNQVIKKVKTQFFGPF
jgi:cytochrome c oxidase accessory protein FixG